MFPVRERLLLGETPSTSEVLADLRVKLKEAFGRNVASFWSDDYSKEQDYRCLTPSPSPEGEFAIPLNESWRGGQRKITTFSDGSWQLDFQDSLDTKISVNRRPDGIINLEGTLTPMDFVVILTDIENHKELSARSLITPQDLLKIFTHRFPDLMFARPINLSLETNPDGKIVLKGASL